MFKHSKKELIVCMMFLILSTLSFMVLSTGCSSQEQQQQPTSSKSTTSAKEINPLGLLPSGPILIASFSMKEYRTPDAMKEYEEMLSSNQQFKEQMDKIKETTGMDIIRDIDSVGFGLYMTTSEVPEPKFILAGSGKFDEQKLIDAIKKEAPPESEITESKYKNYKVYSGKMETDNAFLAFPKDNIVVAANDKAYIEQALDRIDTTLPTALTDSALKDTMVKVDKKAPLWVVGKVPDASREDMKANQESAFMAEVNSYYMFYKQTEQKGMHIEIAALCATPAGADSVKQGVQNLMNQFKPFLSFSPGGEAFTTFFDKALLTAEGNTAKLTIQMTEQELEDFKKKMEAAQTQMQQMMPQQAPAQQQP